MGLLHDEWDRLKNEYQSKVTTVQSDAHNALQNLHDSFARAVADKLHELETRLEEALGGKGQQKSGGKGQQKSGGEDKAGGQGQQGGND